MRLKNNTSSNYTPRQLKLPLVIEKLIELIDISDPVYTFCEVMDHIDLSKYFVEKGCKTGRPKCDVQKLLKVILFAFMEHGISSLRDLEKLCRTDIRFMYLLDDMKAPSFATFGNFIRNELTTFVEQIFNDINQYIFDVEKVDLDHTYIDGTKIEANANRYTWVWKKSCTKNRDKVFEKVSVLIDEINETLSFQGIKIEKREAYAIDYLENVLIQYQKATGIQPAQFVCGRGHRKSLEQHQYQKLEEYKNRLKAYANHIEICGDHRNSYSKTDHDATFMRIKRDYMGNDQLLPAYNLQAAICDEYVAIVDVKPYASDMECFIPLMEKFNATYGHYHFAKLILLPKTDIEFYASSFRDDLIRGTQFHGSYSDCHLPVSKPSSLPLRQSPHPQAEIDPPDPSQSEFTVVPKMKSPDKQRVYGPTAISSQCAHKPCFLGRTPGPRHQTTITFKTILTSEENQANSGTPHIRARGVHAFLSAVS